MMIRALFALPLMLLPLAAHAERALSEDEKIYRNCLTLAAQKPEDGWEEALAWQSMGGGEPARHCAALALVAMKKYEGGAQRLEALAEDSKRDARFKAQILVQAGQAWAMAGKLERAYAVQTTALKLAPKDPEILIDRATTLAATGRHQDALDDLEQALAVSPNRVEALVLKGSALRQLGNAKAAEAAIGRAIELDPKFPDAWIEHGALKAAAGDRDAARKDWLKAIELAPKASSADVARENLQALEAK